jgi:mycoredoxin
MHNLKMYTTSWCPDCRRAKSFLKERGVTFSEINIEHTPGAEEIVLRANNGKCKVPTLEVGGRYFAASPFNAERLATELNLPLKI